MLIFSHMKKNYYKGFIFLIIFVFTLSCNSKKDNGEKFHSLLKDSIFNIYLDSSSLSKSYSLSLIADKIDYIPIETVSESLISNGVWVYYTDSIIFIKDRGRVLRFNNKGIYLSDLFRVGQGPSECFASCSVLDVINERIFIYNNFNNKIDIYNYLGQQIKSFKDPAESYWSSEICVYKDYFILNNNLLFPSFFSVYKLSDFNTLIYTHNNKYQKTLDNKIGGANGHSVSFQNIDNKRFYFKEQFCDTLFYTTDFSTFSPQFIFHWGKINKFDFDTNVKMLTREIKDIHIEDGKYRILNWMEANNYLLFNLYTTTNMCSEVYLGIYDKNNRTLIISKENKLINDIDGGVDFIPLNPVTNNNLYKNQIFSLVWPHEIKDALAKNKAFISLQQKKQLNEIAKHIADDDNPLLMIVTLKNNDNKTN